MNALSRISRTPDASATRPIGGRLRPADHLYRAAHAALIGHVHNKTGADRAARELFGDSDQVTPLVLRAATVPATLGTSAWAGALAQAAVADAIVGLAPASAAAAAIARGLTVSLAGYGSITIPSKVVTAGDAGGFVSEGSPITVRQLTIGGPTLTPNKFATIAGYTREVATFSVQDGSAVVRQILSEAAALALDAAMFSTTAASAGLRPAGILNGVTPITATAGGGQAALATDIGNLFEALAAAGAGADVVLVANPGQAASLRTWA